MSAETAYLVIGGTFVLAAWVESANGRYEGHDRLPTGCLSFMAGVFFAVVALVAWAASHVRIV